MRKEIRNVHIYRHYDTRTRKWRVTVTGITSGFEVHGGDGDNMTIDFGFDADRFEPNIVMGAQQ